MEQRNSNAHQTWNLSCYSRQDSVSEGESEFLNPVDLSCKNPVTPTTIRGTNTTACLSQSLPVHTDKQHQHLSLLDTKKQNPFASTIMLSSSSELDFPRKTTEKYEPSFYNGGNTIKNSIPLFAPPSDVTIEVPFLHPLIPLHLNSGAINNSVATSTTASTSPSYAERERGASSLQTNDKTTETTAVSFLNESSNHSEMSTTSLGVIKKTPRPFKVYSKNPFPILKRQIDPVYQYLSRDYLEYREKMLDYKKMQENAPNPKMRRTSKSPALPTSTADEKDPAYYEKRKKNNEAAKRSRDLRRKKEDELAIWATFLEEENVKLKSELAGLYCLLRQMGMDISQLRALINVNL
ncbi:protein giant-like [Cataglyphis hispanica]|uniref:protein giant-like n=1 Tax=Cataglyphis hispanica TaxID=1086592 RepID=UPI00217FCE91|nr:protein giant-like [Cataglyphis hispanica]